MQMQSDAEDVSYLRDLHRLVRKAKSRGYVLEGADEAAMLRCMRDYIVQQCGDYNKISERMLVCESEGRYIQNLKTTGHDLTLTGTDIRIESKHSLIKMTSKPWRVNAQLTFTSTLVDLCNNACEALEAPLLSDKTIRTFVSALSNLPGPVVSVVIQLEKEIECKMSRVGGGISVAWHYNSPNNPFANVPTSVVVSTIVHKLDAIRWLLQNPLSKPRRAPRKRLDFNMAAHICRKCGHPHRLCHLQDFSTLLESTISQQHQALPILELLTHLDARIIEDFYDKLEKSACDPASFTN